MVEIKVLSADQYAEWYSLWQGYLTFYGSNLSDEITKNNWRRFHDKDEPVGVFGAFKDGKMVGLVHYIYHQTNWSVKKSCYLQDLFADPDCRGEGIGRALIEAVYAEAKKNDAQKVYWLTQNDNKTARQLYDRIAKNTGFIVYENDSF